MPDRGSPRTLGKSRFTLPVAKTGSNACPARALWLLHGFDLCRSTPTTAQAASSRTSGTEVGEGQGRARTARTVQPRLVPGRHGCCTSLLRSAPSVSRKALSATRSGIAASITPRPPASRFRPWNVVPLAIAGRIVHEVEQPQVAGPEFGDIAKVDCLLVGLGSPTNADVDQGIGEPTGFALTSDAEAIPQTAAGNCSNKRAT